MLCSFLRLRLWSLLAVVGVFGGCNWDLDFDAFDVFGGEGLDPVPARLAVGATTIVTIDSDDPDAEVSSADPEVIAVEKLSASRARITAVAPGTTSITLKTTSRHTIYAVAVAQHVRHEVLLVAPSWGGLVPVTEIAGITLLAGVPQQILVALYDSEGLLFSTGVAELVPPEASEACDANVGSFDGRCLVLEAGSHVMQLQIGGQVESISFDAVSEPDVANVVLVRDKEEAAAKQGDLIRVDVLGLTADSVWVYGIPVAESALPFGSPFAYELDPNASSEVLEVSALDFQRQITIHGSYQLPERLTHSCHTSRWFGSC